MTPRLKDSKSPGLSGSKTGSALCVGFVRSGPAWPSCALPLPCLLRRLLPLLLLLHKRLFLKFLEEEKKKKKKKKEEEGEESLQLVSCVKQKHAKTLRLSGSATPRLQGSKTQRL